VQVVHVKDATCYMVRLMEHKATDGTVDSHWNIDAKKLLIAVDLYFANKQNVRSCGQFPSSCAYILVGHHTLHW